MKEGLIIHRFEIRHVFLLVLLTSLIPICAQVNFTGKVLDQKTKAPIPYASVYVENTVTGVATAMDGHFSLRAKTGYCGSVVVRAMGYETKRISQSAFKSQSLRITLSPISYDIEEVVASASKIIEDPSKIVKKAIKRISENMATDYTVLEGCYQQAFQDYETDRLLDANQVEVTVGLQGIKTKQKTDSIWHEQPLSNSRFWQQFRYNDEVLLPQYQMPDYGTNHLQCLLRMDPVRNHTTPTFDFVKRLDRDFIYNHFFWLDSIGTYNGENVYSITVYLSNKIRFNRVNVLSGEFHLTDVDYYSSNPSTQKSRPCIGFTYLSSLKGLGGVIPIGKMKITTEKMAIVYFEYTNGFGNDRYKFMSEYKNYNGKYYPSKLYFANKFRMPEKPDFSASHASNENYLKCLMGQSYYRDLIKQYATENGQEFIDSIIKMNTIACPLSSSFINNQKVYVRKIEAKTKIAEELQDTFLFHNYNKLLHHRYVEFKLTNSDKADQSDFNHYYYPLGDRAFHWNVFYIIKRSDYSKLHTLKHGANRHPNDPAFSYIPMPITSCDEYRYTLKRPQNPYVYDKPNLIKGLVNIWTFYHDRD